MDISLENLSVDIWDQYKILKKCSTTSPLTQQLGASISKDVFEQRKSTGSGFCILEQWLRPNVSANPLCKSKDTKQYKFVSVKAY